MFRLIGLSLLFAGVLPAQSRPEWDDVAVIQSGVEKPHATFRRYESKTAALQGTGAWQRLLNGQWKFLCVPNPSGVPAGVESPSFRDTAWGTIPVPSSQEMHGCGEPVYTNILYPFPQPVNQDPIVPKENNPTGLYRTTFTAPAEWKGKDLFLHFAGVEGAFHAWLNGRKLGYSEDGRTPAEFRITEVAQPGSNTLVVAVYRYSDGSFLEDQDFWRLSGIYRDVWLTAAPKARIRDFEVRTDLDANYRDATLTVVVEGEGADGSVVTAECLTPQARKP